MPTGDFPHPEGMIWTDAFGWVPVSKVERLGADFERVLFDNIWELYERDDRPSLWFWSV